MCKRLSIEAVITDNHEVISKASKLILPGVGHFKRGMENLHASGLTPLINELALVEKKPVLGICLGAQLMTKHSEEGDVEGLGWMDANTVRFSGEMLTDLKVPHMGWRNVTTTDSPLWKTFTEEPRFYFVHTYHFSFASPEHIIGTSDYGYEFACAFQNNNIYGVQFHPEKSHKFGMKVMENFALI